ncbi:universal stress protein [Novipirellula artificiosorum]|uniref:Universal stress protein n=1 Tax=Novipirellula artificiosorum TaxID=2528016 RepID=A0A5C6DMC8_9BACT|nr:universal stress protein [Novipirellula artificiosorum]TWU38503.1 Universal stress protein [Novipirellula artificiosorum]
MTNVIFATDGSQQAEQAAKFLCRLPLVGPLNLTLLTNVFIPSHDADAADPLLKDFREHQEAEAKAYLAKAESILSEKADSIGQQIVHGHIGHSIVEAAEASKCDMIVMGAKGHSGIGRMLLGSTSDYVATHAPCNVIVVRGSSHHEATDPLDLTLAYNETPASQRACEEVAKLEWDASTRVHLLGVVPLFEGFSQDLMPNIVQYRTEQRVAAMRHLETGRELFPMLRDRISLDIIESPHVGESIVNECDKQGCDLVVVGDSRRGSISRMLLGSVSRFVLRHAECSVWIARSRPR